MTQQRAEASGWTEVVWTVTVEAAAELADALSDALESSVLIEEAGAAARLVAAVERAQDTPAWRAGLAARLGALAAGKVEFRTLADRDWKNAWREIWHPFRVRPFAIVPRDHTGTLRPDDVRVVLEPGIAFGTGRHATTRACLAALGALDLGAARVLDAGFGTGVLGVAAALLGARHVDGFDVDRHTLPVAQELAGDNGVAERCSFRVGGFESLRDLPGPYDLIVANIYADVIEQHAGELSQRLAPGGTLIVSGCAREHAPRVRAALTASGRHLRREVGQRWRTFVAD